MRFTELRVELRAEKVVSFTPALVHELAARVATVTLAADERLRTDPEAAQTVLAPVALAAAQIRQTLAIGAKAPALPRGFTEPVDPWMGMPADVAATLADLNEAGAALAVQAVAAAKTQQDRQDAADRRRELEFLCGVEAVESDFGEWQGMVAAFSER